MTSAQVHPAIAAYFTAMSTMNQERWVENFTLDAVIYDPVGNPPSRAIEDADKFFGLLSHSLRIEASFVS